MRKDNGGTMFMEHQSSLHNQRNLVTLFKQSEPPSLFSISNNSVVGSEDESSNSIRNSNASLGSPRYSNSTTTSGEGEGSPFVMSPWNQASPYNKSPWISSSSLQTDFGQNGLIGSIVREEGHIYSLAASGDLLYTGSDSKNIHVWKNLKEFSGFKAKSGLVKAIVILGDRIFTGHQDGKIRVWKVSSSDPRIHKRFGSLPSFKDLIKRSVKPKNYVEVRNKRSVLRIKHYDAVSCLSLNEEAGLLYSGSWDKTVKVWRIANSKCLESIDAHDDAINSVVVGFDSLVFTGSADGTVKVWKRELQGKATKHFPIQMLLKQENAVTSLAVNRESAALYCGSSDGLVNFWEREGEYQLSHGGVLRGHKMAVLCLSTGGNLVFSGSADKSICVWRREEGGVHTCLSVLTGHKGPIKCLAVEEDQQTSTKSDRKWIVYSGSLDKSVKVWRVSERSPDFKETKQGLLNSYGGGANDDTVLGNNISW